MPQIVIRDTGDLKRLAKDLRAASDGKQLRQAFTREVRGALRPVVAAVKIGYGGGSHLRPALRRATRMEVKTTGRQAGWRVRVDGRRMPPRMGSIPAMHEGEKRWRHPVFGNRQNWVSQAARPTFYPIVQAHEGQVAAAVERAADEVRRKLEGGR